MLTHPDIQKYLALAGLAQRGIDAQSVSVALRDLLDALALEDGTDDDALYRYVVPMLSEDGSCSLIEELDPTPYDLSVVLRGRTADTTRKLRLLNRVVDRAASVTGADWLGIYQRRERDDVEPALVKLAYRGRPSRAEFPLTEAFAQGSTNSTVGLSGQAKVIDDVMAYTESGGGFYVCDDAVQSEACLPLFNADRVVGIIDAEAAPKQFFTSARLAVLVAVCLVTPTLLPD